MFKKIFSPLILLLILFTNTLAQRPKTDANIVGHVLSGDKHLPYVNIVVKGTTLGTLTDETGHFQLINVPEGEITLMAMSVGYKSQEFEVTVIKNKVLEVNFNLEEDVMNLDEVVVSASRSEQKRTEAPVMVNTLSPKLFAATQSLTFGEGLNFVPGLRLENNCQNCGFTQVRMNGMEGPYSQILINSRPIFSGLAGVYGLELIPSNMIERVEVIRGGGSALYGSNAIAGTINLILKEPEINTYEIGLNTTFTGVGHNGSAGSAPDYSANFNTSLVSDDRKTGVAVYGFTREREMFDANDDDFSEISPMTNLTLGSRFFHRFGYRSKMSVDFFTISEKRDGGNKQEYPLHERNVAEAIKHNIKTGAITYDKFFREYDMLSVYASGQLVDRESYYGANYSLSDYGHTKDKTYNIGAQYKIAMGKSSLITGIENTGGFLTDEKLGYPDYDNAVIVDDSIVSVPHTENTIVSDQSSVITGAFVQYDLHLNRAKIAIGGRFDHYEIKDHAREGEAPKNGDVFSPRISFMYELWKPLQFRVSYSQGYRAPQIFDEDLHIETSGSRQVINRNDPGLEQETSHSVMVSFDFNKVFGSTYTGLLIEGFYTKLTNPFVNDIGTPDLQGTVIYTRMNAEDGAAVQGVNMEFKLKLIKDLMLSSGFTVQSSKYEAAQEFDEKKFFRTPDHYGFFTLDWDFVENICLNLTGNYTGKMLVPYFGTETNPKVGELRKTDSFFDLGAKLHYNIKLNGATLQLYGGVKNIFDAYQSDFDKTADRDPAYVYGPVSPRTVYIGLKLGNALTSLSGKAIPPRQGRHMRRHMNREMHR
ncbi:MAG: TonB-dependent receptor [Bacteroidales bacterium]|nr:TonB-dependent receptor [Bacteroidales bacterium]